MNTSLVWLRAATVVAALLSAGCASIISGRTATVKIDSNPSDAEVVIHDKHGNEVLTTHTPATVELKRKDRLIFPAKYIATIEKPGYRPARVPIDSKINPWILGNVVAGGVIGLAVDNVTGAAWKPRNTEFVSDLKPLGAGPSYAAEDVPRVPVARAPSAGDGPVETASGVY